MDNGENNLKKAETTRAVSPINGQPVPSNPLGRPKGSKNKISEDFLRDLSELWDTKGKKILDEACAESPLKFVQMVADLLPKEATINVNETFTLRSESIQALDDWLASVGRDGADSKAKDALPN